MFTPRADVSSGEEASTRFVRPRNAPSIFLRELVRTSTRQSSLIDTRPRFRRDLARLLIQRDANSHPRPFAANARREANSFHAYTHKREHFAANGCSVRMKVKTPVFSARIPILAGGSL